MEKIGKAVVALIVIGVLCAAAVSVLGAIAMVLAGSVGHEFNLPFLSWSFRQSVVAVLAVGFAGTVFSPPYPSPK